MPDLTLSFDNGPESEVTPVVLDELARRDLRTTFFVIGRKAATAAGRRLCERALAEGHRVANHSWTHETPLGEMPDFPETADAEIGRTQRLLETLVGHAPEERLFRPFGGAGRLGPHLLNQAAVRHLTEGGFTCVLWNAVPRDWIDPDGWVETALAQIAAQPWTLMVLHDINPAATARLPRFLDAVAGAGIRLREDFPPDCIPIRDGRIVRPVEPLTSG